MDSFNTTHKIQIRQTILKQLAEIIANKKGFAYLPHIVDLRKKDYTVLTDEEYFNLMIQPLGKDRIVPQYETSLEKEKVMKVFARALSTAFDAHRETIYKTMIKIINQEIVDTVDEFDKSAEAIRELANIKKTTPKKRHISIDEKSK